jgi:SAM-dependent methyltransferase
MTYEDHFSGHAGAYARHRPRYPDALFAWLASVSPGRALAWDAGTGNGQVAVALAGHIDHVVATDASSDQLAHAVPHERVEYRNEPADHGSLAPSSVDLITAGAAAHWFDLEGFYREVKRVGKSGAVIALFSYGPRDLPTPPPRCSASRSSIASRRRSWPAAGPSGSSSSTTATPPFPFPSTRSPPRRSS